jgi:hypothetical protein
VFDKPENVFILLLLCIPLVAVVGGIVVGIVRAVSQQRQLELLQRERIVALERGVDPRSLPAAPPFVAGDPRGPDWTEERARRQSQALLVGGIVTLSAGIGLVVFFAIVEQHGEAWAVGILPIAVALGLLSSAWLVRPRGPRPPL